MTTENPPKRPPSDRGQGRKPLPPEQKTVIKSCRLKPDGWAKFAELGGNKWLAQAVDDAHKLMQAKKAKAGADKEPK